MQLATRNVAAKETEKLSEELAQIEKDIQIKEQQFLVSIIFVKFKLHISLQLNIIVAALVQYPV